jgi:translation initiation factor IF-3
LYRVKQENKSNNFTFIKEFILSTKERDRDLEPRINEDIRSHEVLLIDKEGNKVGVVPLKEALEQAREADLDLVEISPNVKPPVCKILDYGKFRFEKEKKEREARKKQKKIETKEIRLQPGIDSHDYGFKLEHIKNFLAHGDKVKITIRFKGRQMAHTELGRDILLRYKADLVEFGVIDSEPVFEGKSMSMLVAPITKKTKQ